MPLVGGRCARQKSNALNELRAFRVYQIVNRPAAQGRMTRDPHRSGENFGRSPALFGMRREAHGRKSLRSRALQWRCEAFASMRKSDYPHSSSWGAPDREDRRHGAHCRHVRPCSAARRLFGQQQSRGHCSRLGEYAAAPGNAVQRAQDPSPRPRSARGGAARSPCGRAATRAKETRGSEPFRRVPFPAHTGEIVPKAALRRHRRRRRSPCRSTRCFDCRRRKQNVQASSQA